MAAVKNLSILDKVAQSYILAGEIQILPCYLGEV